jgi:hypothetical protein
MSIDVAIQHAWCEVGGQPARDEMAWVSDRWVTRWVGNEMDGRQVGKEISVGDEMQWET